MKLRDALALDALENDKLSGQLIGALHYDKATPQSATAAFIFNSGGGGDVVVGDDGEVVETQDPTEVEELSDVTGENATLASIGTDENDTLSAGDREPDTFFGMGGEDVIYASNGNDTIYGGRGVADDEDASDSIFGNTGNDLIYGNTGNDTVYGGNDIVFFGDGEDTIYGGRGSDSLFGGGGNDSIAGGGGIAHPEDEADTIYGGRGDDSILGNGGDDYIVGGTGGSIDDSDFISDGSDTIYGGFGNDKINGGGPAADLIYGQFGNDTLEGGGEVDLTAGIDTIYGGDGNDLIYGETASEAASADPLYGEDPPEDPFLYPDLLYGEAGVDTIYGGDGDDTIYGGTGNDLLYGGEGSDVFIFLSGEGVDVIYDFQPEYDTIWIQTNINGLDVTNSAEALALSYHESFGRVIDIGNGTNNLILLDDYMYEDSDSDPVVIRRLPFDEINIEVF